MKAIVEKVLKLTASSEVKLWSELESQVLSAAVKLPNEDYINVLQHYGEHEKGSPQFWTSCSQHVTKNFKNFNQGELMGLFDAFAFAGTQYTFAPEFEQLMIDGVFNTAKLLEQALDAEDPNDKPNIKQDLEENFEAFNELEDPYLEFQDDLKLEGLQGKEKETAKTVREIVAAWQKTFLGLK